MSEIKPSEFSKEDKALIKKAVKKQKIADRNEIKTQRRAWLFGTVAAIGLMAILDKRRK